MILLLLLYYDTISIATFCRQKLKCLTADGTGFPHSWKVLDFFGYNFQVLESPGKWVWSWKVLEIWVQGPGKSLNFLGYDNDVGADKMMQVQVPKFACSHISTDCSVKWILVTAHLYCIIHLGILPLFTVRFGRLFGSAWSLLYLNITGVRQGPGKMLLGSWKSPGNFFNQDSGNLDGRPTGCGVLVWDSIIVIELFWQ